MSLAVAAQKIGESWSCSQFKSVPNMRLDNPPSADSADAEANAFSISSIHSTTGAMDSACLIAWRRLRSDSPTNLS